MASKNSKKTEKSIDFAKDVLKSLDAIKRLEQNPELLKKFADLLKSSEEKYSIPDYIFTKKLTLLEAVVKFLKENSKLNYKEIAELINRDSRNIWQVYNSSKKKYSSKFKEKESQITIPVSVLSTKKFSVLESVVAYLKSNGHTYHEIAMITKRDDRTIWTVYNRYKKKNDK